MKPFVVIFALKPAVRINPKFTNFDFKFNESGGEKRIIITPIVDRINEKAVQTGLVFRAYVNADNVNQARICAKSFVDGVIGLITFTTGVGLQIPNEILAYEITPNTEQREMLQIFYNPANIALSRREVNHDFFVKFTDQIYKQSETAFLSVARAIRWYRMGTLTFDVFDKFTCCWIGLEALNPLLKHRLNTEEITKKIKCDECGNEMILEVTTVTPINCFINNKMQNPKLFKKLRELRVKLMHSTCELSRIGEEINDLTPKLAEVLFRAVCFLLDFEDWNSVSYKGILENVPMRIEIEGKLLGNHLGNLGYDGKDPHLEPSFSLDSLNVMDDGSITFSNTSNFKMNISPFKSFRIGEFRMYGDKETKGKMTNIGKESKRRDS